MKGSNVLLVVEGEKTEKKLFEHFYHLYGLYNTKIVAYGSTLYSMYNRMKKDYHFPNHPDKIDFGNLDLVLFLNEHLQLESEELLDEKDFSDIILIFDFDPQDPSYSAEIIKEMLEHFNDSTATGKLFINYPMVESYKDFKSLNDEEFLDSAVGLTILTKRIGHNNQYKSLVNARSFIKNWHYITRSVGNYILKSKKEKIEHLLNTEHKNDIYKNFFIFQENHFSKFEEIYIINTSLLHLFDEYGFIKE